MDKNTLELVMAPAIVGVVESLKPILPPGAAGIVAVVLGGVGGTVLGLASGDQGPMLLQDLMEGVVVGAAAAGVHTLAAKVGGPAQASVAESGVVSGPS